MRHYTQLAQEQRYQIFALMKAGNSQTDIAGIIGVHKSTVSRELRRNRGGRGYRPKQARKALLSSVGRARRKRDWRWMTGTGLKPCCAMTGARSRLASGWRRRGFSGSVTSGFITTFTMTRVSGVIYICTFATASSAGSAMEVTAAGVSCRAGFLLTSAPPLLSAVVAWETGNSTPSSAKTTRGR